MSATLSNNAPRVLATPTAGEIAGEKTMLLAFWVTGFLALAVGIVLVPMLVVESYDFNSWLYRALIFLVISCPCALVISIPLGYFGGIGAASREGILLKGGNYLDVLTKVNTVPKLGPLLSGSASYTFGVFLRALSTNDSSPPNPPPLRITASA